MMNVNRNFAKHASLEYMLYDIDEYFDPANIISMRKVCAIMFDWLIDIEGHLKSYVQHCYWVK